LFEQRVCKIVLVVGRKFVVKGCRSLDVTRPSSRQTAPSNKTHTFKCTYHTARWQRSCRHVHLKTWVTAAFSPLTLKGTKFLDIKYQ